LGEVGVGTRVILKWISNEEGVTLGNDSDVFL
jgi:hypothetical protein